MYGIDHLSVNNRECILQILFADFGPYDLFLIMFIVELLLDYNGWEKFFAYLYVYFGTNFRVLRIDEGKGETMVYADTTVTGCNYSDLLTVFHHGIAVARYSTVFQCKTYEFFIHPVSLLFDKGFFADKFFFIQLAKHA